MKLIPILTAAAVALAVGPAAYAKDCPARPARIQLPNGATASEADMKATQAKFPSYAREMSAYLQCLASEIKSGKDEYEQVAADWKHEEDTFTKTPAKQ
jgi:hypothetical protein